MTPEQARLGAHVHYVGPDGQHQSGTIRALSPLGSEADIAWDDDLHDPRPSWQPVADLLLSGTGKWTIRTDVDGFTLEPYDELNTQGRQEDMPDNRRPLKAVALGFLVGEAALTVLALLFIPTAPAPFWVVPAWGAIGIACGVGGLLAGFLIVDRRRGD